MEALAPVIDWHRRGLVPNGKHLTHDGRCVYRHADFFDLARGEGFDPDVKDSQFDAVEIWGGEIWARAKQNN